MALHGLSRITVGVPNVAETASYYADFGLAAVDGDPTRLATVDGGEQLRLVPSERRRLVELVVAAEDQDDLARTARGLRALDFPVEASADAVRTHDAGTGVDVTVALRPRVEQTASPVPAYNAPGSTTRPTSRAAGVLRETPVRPRKLGHVVVGTTDQERSRALFTDALGFKVSDEVTGVAAFLRCSTDHHNVLVQRAPMPFLHHTSWQVDDVDEVGRGATAMLAKDPERHVWGLGRHHIGSNFFWYLKDPAGNFSEYYSDLDCIVDDELWTPQTWEGLRSLYSWGPPIPQQFLAPDDLVALMTAAQGS